MKGGELYKWQINAEMNHLEDGLGTLKVMQELGAREGSQQQRKESLAKKADLQQSNILFFMMF